MYEIQDLAQPSLLSKRGNEQMMIGIQLTLVKH